jgi:hypothetical protein
LNNKNSFVFFLLIFVILAMADKFLVDPTEFIHIFLKNPSELIDFLEHIHKVIFNKFLVLI